MTSLRTARTRHRRHELGPPPHRWRHSCDAPLRIQRVQLGAAQRWYATPLPDTQLFDLQEDPFELHNRAGDPALAHVEADLNQRLDDHLRGTGDPILAGPVPNRAGEPDVPQWHRQPDGTFRLAPDDPPDPSEISFT